MADPISMAVGTAVLTATGSFAVASAAVTTFWVAVASAAVSAVVVDRQRRAAANSRGLVNDDRSLQQAIPQAAPQHALVLGMGHWAGSPFFIRGGKDNRPFLHIGRLLAAHECDGLDSVWINGTRVEFDPVTLEATSVPFNDGATVFLYASFRNGSIDQAIDPILAADFPDLPSSYRQRGQCSVVLKAHYGTGANRDAQDDKHRELYGDGEFQPQFRLRGAKVFDPRSYSQSLADADSWAWTRNAALNAAHYLCWKWPDMRNRLDWDRIAEAAEICDIYRNAKDGTPFRQFTADGVVLATDPAPDAVSDLLSASGGKLIRRAGKFYIYPSQAETPVGTLHRGNVRGAIQYANGAPKGQISNIVTPEFFSPERGFKIVPGPVIRDANAIVADNEERPRTERYPFTEYHYRAQRLATVEYRQGRQQETLTAGCDLTALKWDAGRVINLDLGAVNPALTGTWRLVSKAWSESLNGYTLQLVRHDEADGPEGFDPATDEQNFEVEEI